MANPLFDRLSPAESSACRQVIEFEGKIDDFERLSEIVAADLGALGERAQQWRSAPVQFRLAFGWESSPEVGGQKAPPLVEVRASAKIVAVCQRCLQICEYDLSAFARMLVVGQDANPKEYADFGDFEIWELAEETLRPLDIVEESLVMAMPLAPKHADAEDCVVLVEAVQDDRPKKILPFADLRSQLEKKNN